MTDQPLSPAAQAVMDAALFEVNAECYAPWIAAAALRAAADQVVPEQKPWHRTSDATAAKHAVRLELLSIAAELEGQ